MLLELRDVGYAVPERRLFRALDLALAEGEIVVLHGPSGAGKTTLLRLIAGLLPVQEGEILFEGRTLKATGACRWRADIGYCPQGGPVMRGSPRALLERVSALAVRAGRRIDDPLRIAEEWGLPEARWERPFAELSSGERQRVQLAITLGGRPRVLLLDEPTSALDPRAREAVEESLREHSCLLVTHDEEQVRRLAARSVELGS